MAWLGWDGGMSRQRLLHSCVHSCVHAWLHSCQRGRQATRTLQLPYKALANSTAMAFRTFGAASSLCSILCTPIQ